MRPAYLWADSSGQAMAPKLKSLCYRLITPGLHPWWAMIFWCFRLHIEIARFMQWSITRLLNNTFSINLNGRIANVVNGSLKLTGPNTFFEWMILKGAPSPPPIGTNSFGLAPASLSYMTLWWCYRRIIAPNQHSQESWFIGSTEGDQGVEVPVSFSLFRSTISSHYLRLGYTWECRILNRHRLCSKINLLEREHPASLCKFSFDNQ